jgi:hypothetical protein
MQAQEIEQMCVIPSGSQTLTSASYVALGKWEASRASCSSEMETKCQGVALNPLLYLLW